MPCKQAIKVGLLLWAIAAARPAPSAISVQLTPNPNPPEAGDGVLEILLKDEQGKPLDDAKLDVLVFMPAMGTMPRMEEKATVTPKGNGLYVADFNLPTGGTWEISGTFETKNTKESFHATLTTGIPDVPIKGQKGRATTAGLEQTNLMDVGPERLQLIGVRFAEAKVAPMSRNIEAVGVVEQDQTHREEVTLRVSGYVVKQFRGREGDLVKAGDPLFSVYSPDLVTAQSEFLLAENLSGGGQSLHQAAGEKLKNLGLSTLDISSIRKTGKPKRDVVIRSPINGTILGISVREGAAVSAGQPVYIIGDLNQSYIVARIFQQDVGSLKVGQPAEVSAPGAGSTYVPGKINLVYPQVQQGAGTANVRIEVKEYVEGLRPGAYLNVRIPVELGSMLSIPSESILYSGKHRYVFVDHGGGLLEPREIDIGQTAEGLTQIKGGLAAGDRVAASGTFLLGSEAQLRSALPKWRTSPHEAPK